MSTKIQTQDIANNAITAAKLAIVTTKGDLLGFDTTAARIPVGTDGQVLTASSGANLGVAWAAAPSVATTKGDLCGYSTVPARLAVGTDGQVLTASSAAATGLAWATLSLPVFVDNEVPSGVINGSNTTFTLANTPVAGSVHLHKNGLRQAPTTDFTISGATITFVAGNIPQTGDILIADYRR